MNKTKIICISGIIMAMYIAIMFATQGFAFGAYQIRIATALYALSYTFPFLVLPLALANMLANAMGPMGVWDMLGGFAIGLITSGGVYLVRRFNWPMLLVIPIIILAPALVVPIWLSYILSLPYFALVISIGIGQILPAIVGYLLIKMLGTHVKRMGLDGQ
ncbi:MAG: QueT transporter family protein [Defluviitaleaceae bacterium]|nr:QueT transporter family protein [Defluviitaleaceae bacterium]